MTLDSIRRHLRLRPFPQDTEEGRTSERYRRALWAMLANAAARIVALATLALSVSLTVPYLGAERFGAWMTVSSLVAVLGFLDLGVGNALTNRVAHATGTPGAVAGVVTGGLALLAAISLVSISALVPLAAALPWDRLIKVSQASITEEVRSAAMMVALLFGLSIFSGGVARVFHGMQRGVEVHLAGIAGSLAAILALFVAVDAEAGMPWLLVCLMGGPIAANLSMLFVLARRSELQAAGWTAAMRAEAPYLLRLGGLFFLLQIGTIVASGADSLIIASYAGAGAVAAYSVTQRLTLIVSQPLSIMNAPLWAAYAEAAARQDRAFIRATLWRSLKITFLAAAGGALLLVLAGQAVINAWTHGEVRTSLALLAALSVWMLLEATGNALGILLNGLNVIRQQVIIVFAFVVTALPLKLWWVQSQGATGVVLAGIAAYLLTTVLGYGVIFRRSLMEKHW